MNNTKTLHLNMRNKLMAAVAMLLVASIMMVSTTYAWFTLSTAPEVQGITTTVGANGNLEIALAPLNGDANLITSAMGDSNSPWIQKNLTWGNLLNLEDPSYGLEDITLLPARLNFASGSNQSDATLGTNPLSTPVYGSDGRIQSLTSNTAMGSKYELDESSQIVAAQTYMVNNFKGVRAVGTSSSMSEQEITFNNSMSKVSVAWSNSKTSANVSLSSNGAALAEMAINHANTGSGDADTNNYVAYVPSLESVVTKLEEANDYLEVAIKYSLLAAASSSLNSGDSADEAYTYAVGVITDEAKLADLLTDTKISNLISAEPNGIIQGAITNWQTIDTMLAEARTAVDALDGKSSVLWTDVSGVMNNLMNTSGVTINNKNLSDMKNLLSDYMSDDPSDEAIEFGSSLMAGVQVQLATGSGVYAYFGETIGNISAPVTIDNIAYGDIPLRNVKATISTVTEPNNGSQMKRINLALATAGAMEVEGTSSVIDVTYGYVVDFFFRTNASGSSLKLQTQAAQRVYTDSESAATMGNGSSMTFLSGTISGQAVIGIMECVRVVFMDPETYKIFGIGKLDVDNIESTLISEATDGGNDVYELKAPLNLYNYTITNGVIVFGEQIIEENATLTELAANTAVAVSAMVYLDGDEVDNSDVANAETSMTGTLNLQFASTANLVPMENTALKNMEAAEKYKVTVQTADGTKVGSGEVEEGQAINYATDAYPGYTIVSATMGGEAQTIADGKLSISSVSGEIVIIVEANAATEETGSSEATGE